jgi:protein-S-isoprenylcysteine O-methyltransferase Ste14
MTAAITPRSTMVASMSTASNAIKTGLFTLFVPLVVALWIPQRMIATGHAGMAAPLVWQVVGSLLFVLGVIGYFWCAALFVRAQGTPAPIFPTKSTVVSGPYRVNRNPMYSSVLAVVFGQAFSIRTGEWLRMEYFSPFSSTSSWCSTRRARYSLSSMGSTKSSVGVCRDGSRGRTS